MKEIRIQLECFNIDAFLARTAEFVRGQVSPGVDSTSQIVSIQTIGDVPVFDPESGWDVLSALIEEGKMAFFPFAYADADGTLTCADGNTYGPGSAEEDSEDEQLIGLEDSIGFLVKIREGVVIINSAVHAGGGCTGPTPSVDFYPDCGVLEEPMEKFIRGFIKG